MEGYTAADWPEVLHPRPQMARSRWIDLRGPWGFAYDDQNIGVDQRWQEYTEPFDRTIIVPFPPESPASGIGDTGFHPVVWYRTTFEVSPEDDGKRLILHFGAVDYRACVWVNGRMVASHEGGNTPFEADITPYLRVQSEQVIVVRAEDLAHDLGQPRGKQDWQEHPHNIWYHRTTGIWQPVWLEPVFDTHITDVRWTCDLDHAVLSVGLTLNRPSPVHAHVRVRLILHGEVLSDDLYSLNGSTLQRDIALDLGSTTMSRDRVLWQPRYPNLIDATITLVEDGHETDVVLSYAGLRTVGVAGGRFLLNGRPYYLRLALEQGYWPESHLASPSDEALRREVELARQLGFNGLRIHQKVEDPRFLYWCDRLGLMVWGEMANAYVFSRTSAERLTAEWVEVLRRDYSHPCIIAWVPLNESWGVPNLPSNPAQQDFVRAIYYLTKSLDPTRPVVANDGWEFLCGDIFGIHDYTFHGETIRERYGTTENVRRTLREVQPSHRFVTIGERENTSIPVMLTEFGGISFRPSETEEWFGYGTVGSREAYEQKYEELIGAVLSCPPVAGFCYTQLTDTAQETNGLLTAWREPKLDSDFIYWVNRQPAAAIAGDIVEQLRSVRPIAFGGQGAAPPLP